MDKKKDVFSIFKKEFSIIKLGFLLKKFIGLRVCVECLIYIWGMIMFKEYVNLEWVSKFSILVMW